MKRLRVAVPVGLALLAAVIFSGCESKADKAAHNITVAAENFEVQRRIVIINGITDKVLAEIDGKCSLETSDSALAGSLEVTCKYGPNDFRKLYVGLSDNVSYVSTQVKGIKVSEYRTRVILKPQNVVPNLDLVSGG